MCRRFYGKIHFDIRYTQVRNTRIDYTVKPSENSLFMIYHKYCVTEWEKFGTEKKCSYFGVVYFLEVLLLEVLLYVSFSPNKQIIL